MKKQFFSNEKDGFYGTYYENPKGANCAMIGLFGDDPNDFMAKCGAKWLHKNGVNVMCMSPDVKNYGHVNFPLERIETSIKWLKSHGNKKIGIMGMSTAGMDSLVAASYFPDITLTFGLTPSDFVWQGFEQGEKDGCKEWPIPDASTLSWQGFMQGKKDGCKDWPMVGESLFSYKGKPLPYMPFCYRHPDYWRIISEESKRTGNMIASRKLFDDSEAAHPITEEEFIKVENIRGKLFLVGAEDDALWDTAKYIRRMEKRLAEKPHSCEVEAVVYEHGTHFVFPDGMLKTMLLVGSALFVKLAFSAAKKYPKECKTARIDIDRRMTRVICDWRDKK